MDVCAEDVTYTEGEVSRDVTVPSGRSRLRVPLAVEHRFDLDKSFKTNVFFFVVTAAAASDLLLTAEASRREPGGA